MYLNVDQRSRDNVAVETDDGRVLSYGDICDYVAKFPKILSERCLMFLLCKNKIESLLGYLAAIENNVVPVMLNSKIENDLLFNLFSIYHPQYIWLPSDKVSLFGGDTIYTYYDYSLIKTKYDSYKLNDKLALCLTTSGSTGSPKLVRLSKYNLESNASSIAEYLNIDENERPITSLPMNYSYGLSVINSHLLKGAKILLTDKDVLQSEFWTFCKHKRATSISGVPYTYEMLKRLRIFKMSLPDLKVMTQAGGKLNPNIAKEYMEYAKQSGKRFYVMYGQTEATARISYLPWEVALDKCASIGVAIPNGKLTLIDANDNEITVPDVEGEMLYEGPNVSLGYAECIEDLQKGDENGGILHTGDIAKQDADGYYYITGRMKRFLKIYGQRISLDGLDQMIKDEFDTDCYCSGNDQKLRILVTNETILDKVAMFLESKIHVFHKDIDVIYVEEIKRNESGKVIMQ